MAAPKHQPKPAVTNPAGDAPAKAYFIVNPHGTIHSVTREHAAARLRQVGYRMATKEEVQALTAAGGRQRVDRPLARPYSPDPDAQVELGDEA